MIPKLERATSTFTRSEPSASNRSNNSSSGILSKWDKIVRMSMNDEKVPRLRATMHGEDNFSIRRQTDSKATEVTTARKVRNEPAAGADRPIRRSSLSGPLPSIAAVDEEVYDIFEFRDFKDRMRASKRVTAMSIHQAIHTDEDPLQAKAAAAEASQRRNRRLTLQSQVMKRVLSSINSVSFAEESTISSPSSLPPMTSISASSSSSSLESSFGAITPEEEPANDLKSRYMRAISMNLHQESCR